MVRKPNPQPVVEEEVSQPEEVKPVPKKAAKKAVMFDDSENELEKSYKPPAKAVKVEVKKKSTFDDSEEEEVEFKPPPTRATQPIKKAAAKKQFDDSDDEDDFQFTRKTEPKKAPAKAAVKQ